MLKSIAIYLRLNPARVSAYISCLILYINKHFPQIPLDILIPSVLIIVASGEYAQREEDRKTIKALYIESNADIPDEAIIKKLCYNSNRENKRGGK
jgi:hypothetical protein